MRQWTELFNPTKRTSTYCRNVNIAAARSSGDQTLTNIHMLFQWPVPNKSSMRECIASKFGKYLSTGCESPALDTSLTLDVRRSNQLSE